MSKSLKLKNMLISAENAKLLDKLVEHRIFTDRNAAVTAALGSLMAGLIEIQRTKKALDENVPSAKRPGDTGETQSTEGPAAGAVTGPVSSVPNPEAG